MNRAAAWAPAARWMHVCALACAAVPAVAGPSVAAVDLGETRSVVVHKLRPPLRDWSPSHCPHHRIELRHRHSLWLKLVYGPDDRLGAAGVFQLARPVTAPQSARPRVALRWPGLVPGDQGRTRYPPARHWQPLLESIGAKQWLWIEESLDPSDPPGRSRYIGAAVVNEASGFAGGRDFPFDVAQGITAMQASGGDWAKAPMAQPLLAWRRRTVPNAFIETLDASESPAPGCGWLTLALPAYTDFGP